MIVTAADRDDLVVGCEVDSRDSHAHAEQRRFKREREMVLEHREQAGDLLGLVVALVYGTHQRRP